MTTVDESGIITITLVPEETYVDSLISGTVILKLEISDDVVSGDSIYNFRTNKVSFVLDLKEYLSESGVQAEPYLMGINNDWTEGYLMEAVNPEDPNTDYMKILSGYAPGDVINFAFRNGNIWETTSTVTRIHTVTGSDIVNAEFGVITTGSGTKHVQAQTVHIYPNPAKDQINVSLSNNKAIAEMKITNLLGQYVSNTQYQGSTLDISALKAGIYLLVTSDISGNVYRSQFIKE